MALFSVCILTLNFRWQVAFFPLLLCEKSCWSPGLQYIQKKTEQIHTVGRAMDKLASYLPVLYFNSGPFHYLFHFTNSADVCLPCSSDIFAHQCSHINNFPTARSLCINPFLHQGSTNTGDSIGPTMSCLHTLLG